MDDWDEWDDPGFDDDEDLEADEYDGRSWSDEDEDEDAWDDEESAAEDPWDDAEDLEEWDAPGGSWDGGDTVTGGGGGAAAAGASSASGGGRTMGAWEFGTATAVAGWLLDRQADRIVEAVRASAPGPRHDPGTSLPPAEPWQRLPVPPLDPSAGPLGVGAALDASGLHGTLSRWLAAGADAVLEARDAEGSHRLAVLVSPLVPARPVWVVAEEHPDGFGGTRLLPLFSDGGGGRWVCAVDGSRAAVAAVGWALERHGLSWSALRRTN
jgi:hypothetical protein